MYYRYDGLKINNGWTHPVSGIVYTLANWFDCIEDEADLLTDFGVTRHPDPIRPDYDPATQKPPQINATGEYDAPVNYTQAELAAQELSKDVDRLQSAGKDAVLVLTELVSGLLASGTIKAADFTTDVRQAYLDLKTIADRVK